MIKANLKWLSVFLLIAQSAGAQSILDGYIKTGLDSNLALKQKSFDLKKSRIDLERAKALFYPQAGLNAQYTVAHGGRTIDVPLGDLLNDTYSTLNQLTSSSKFPQVQNQSIQFLPNDFHDTKIEVSMPIYNPSLSYNKKIREEQIHTQQVAINLYKRELVNDIKQAYYQYLQSVKALDIYENALVTVKESLRFNEKLLKNNATTRETVLRAKAQVSQVQTSVIEARQNQKNATAYLNFLLNRPLETAVLADSTVFESLQHEIHVEPETPVNREELLQLKSSQKVLETNLRLTEAYRLPVLSGFYNVGFQGFGYQFNDKQFYQLGGLQLQWNIFKGNDNKLKARQARIDIDAIENQYNNTEKQLLLQVVTANNSYQSALEAMHSANDEVISTKEAYRLTQSRYLQGQALQIELIDARTQMTNAEVRYSLTQLAVLNRAAELERAMATYRLEP